MAALQTIRGKAGLLITVIGVALLAFILSDVFTSGNALFNKIKDNAFSVDGDVVSTGEYSKRREEREFFESIMSQTGSLDEASKAQVGQMVFQQMVRERALDDQAQKLGLAVTPEELSDMVYGANISPILYRIPIFTNPQTGQFDKALLTEFLGAVNRDASTVSSAEAAQELTTVKQVWMTLENLLKYQRLEEKYTSLVAGTAQANALEVDAFLNDSKQQSDIVYVLNRYSTIADSTVSVTDAEIKALYEKKKNNFKLDGDQRKVSYFVKDVIPSEEDYATVEVQMNEGAERLRTTDNPTMVVSDFPGNRYLDAYFGVKSLPADMQTFVATASIGAVNGPTRNNEEYVMYKLVDKTVGPDSVKLQMIPLPQGLDMQRTEFLADSLIEVIKKGRNFATLADEYSPGSDGGQLPMFDEARLIAGGIAREVVDASQGTVMKTKIGGQTQIVRVMAKSKPVQKVKIAEVRMPVIIGDKTQNAIDNELSEFMNANGNLNKFNEGARSQGYSLMSDVVLHPAQMSLDQDFSTRSVIHWAFTEKVGTVKKFDFQSKRIVAIVTGEIEGKYMPVSEVRAILKDDLIKDKKAEKMIADLKSKNATSLNQYATNLGLNVDTASFVSYQTNQIARVGQEPIFNVYAKIGQVNKMSEPLKGQAGVYVLDVLNRVENSSLVDKELAKQQVGNSYIGQMMGTASMSLIEKMNVEDNRVNFW